MTTASEASERDARKAAALLIAGALGPILAHELRNTLASIGSAIFLARRDAQDPERLADLAHHLLRAEEEVHKGHAVIDRVLDLARGAQPLLEPWSVAEIVSSARIELDDLPVRLEVQVSPPDLELWCDAVLLQCALTNLLANARDELLGRDSGRITVRAHPRGDEVVIEVEDDGSGIDPAIAPRLFELRATGKPRGTGLGLAACRAIVQAHGGTIEALAAPVRGALFRITLPAKPD